MSMDYSGLHHRTVGKKLMIHIEDTHPLLQLSDSLDWWELAEMVIPDLKNTTKKKKWWLGRPLRLKIHLSAYLLQQLFNLTDRQTEYGIRDNAAYQLFCGISVVKKWHCPDHTKIEEFRSRLSPETQKKLANSIAKKAVDCGYAHASDIDIDSTIQEANMSYPSDSNLLCKLSALACKAVNYVREKTKCTSIKSMEVNLKRIKSCARRYFFLPKKTSKEARNTCMKTLLEVVHEELDPVLEHLHGLSSDFIKSAPWNIKRAIKQLLEQAGKYLSDVAHFIKNRKMVPDKRLSFHLKEVKCITKNKPGKQYHFGRTFQIGRISGDFLFVGKGEEPHTEDKKSIDLMMETHAETFGDVKKQSVATDKGYYSKTNEKTLDGYGVEEIGLQRPNNLKSAPIKPLPPDKEQDLINRRSGIEPLIGHAKHGGQLGRSRMKSDQSIESSGYTSILGFNLRQMIRYRMGKNKKKKEKAA